MIRLVLFFVLLALVAYGGVYLVEHPGHITLDWFGWQVESSAALLIIAVAIAAIVAWVVLRVVVGLPSFVAYTARRRRREKGYEALSRGLVAVNAGDARTASKASAQASRQLQDDPLALMLRAQSARLAGDAVGAVQAYERLVRREDTRVLGLRGLHAEASYRGDDEAARHFAAAAHRAQPLPWSAQAQLEHQAGAGDWEEALRTVEAGVAARHLDKAVAARQRAVLETAIGQNKELSAPDEALALARAALGRAPDLAPAAVLATRLLSRRGDVRKAAKLVEKAWPRCPHPDLAEAYMAVRPGDSTTDRLARARTLMGLNASDPIGRLTVARAALANTDYAAARSAMEPLVGEGRRPTVKMCLLMAELEEAEHGDHGLWREWLSRASRAALDPAWMADGIVYDEWGPCSPTTGRLDAFRWQVPVERPGATMEALPPRPRPPLFREQAIALPAAAEEPASSVAAAAPAAAAATSSDAEAANVGQGEADREADVARTGAAPPEQRAAELMALPSESPVAEHTLPPERDDDPPHREAEPGPGAPPAATIYSSG